MTTQNIVENIKTVFPELEEARIIKDLSNLQKAFATETKLLMGRASLSSPTTNVAWALPTNFVELYGEDPIRFYNSDGEPIYFSSDSFNYAYEIQFGKLYIYSLSSTLLTGLSADIASAYIHYHKKATTITARTSLLEIEDTFTKALEHGLLSDYFSKFPTDMLTRDGRVARVRDIQSADWHLKRYQDYKIKAKIYAKTREYDKQSNVQYYGDAGEYQLPRRADDSALGSTILPIATSLSNIYAKYVLYYFTPAEAGEITAQIPAIGFTPVATKTGRTVVLTSSGEFGTDINVIANDGGTGWSYDSSSQITIDLPLSYTSVAIEIWERL